MSVVQPQPGPKWTCAFCGARLRTRSERMVSTCWKCEHETASSERAVSSESATPDDGSIGPSDSDTPA